jgi:SAM-dependent methyltransferase
MLSNPGYCLICEQPRQFIATSDWLRDTYLCAGCGTIPRQRALMEVLNRVAPLWPSLTLHESSPSIPFLRQCRNYSCSFYFPDVAPGKLHPGGSRCENLEQLTFPDESFDLFVTQDVLEHVFHPDRALAEITRVLKPGGIHVFTTPRHPIPKSRQRAAITPDGVIQHLLEAQYHGNPIDPKGSLVTWDYGMDFDSLISRWSGYLTSCYVIRDRARGIDGEFLDVWATRKDPVNAIDI